ncbi:MAG: NAD(P)-binding domain-containing protein [Acidobacteriota bacterium]
MDSLAIVGVGSVGAALGERFAETGHQIVFGVRPGRDVSALLARCGEKARAIDIATACAAAPVVFLAVPHEAAVAALEGIDLAGKIVVDCTNPVSFADGSPAWDPPPAGSMAAELAKGHPLARWVKGFSTMGAQLMRHPELAHGFATQVHLAADDVAAKEQLAKLISGAGFVPLDAGPLRNAAALENLAILWIHLAMKGDLGREWAFQTVGRG